MIKYLLFHIVSQNQHLMVAEALISPKSKVLLLHLHCSQASQHDKIKTLLTLTTAETEREKAKK